MAEMTPMMRQYMEIKEQNKDSILFFRLGDFYEMFGDDARKASRELDLTLTTRDKDKNKSFEEKIPMCGIPYHASDAYIARLIAKGYKVAICEQTEDPAAAKGLVERDIVRIVTPGTVIDSACLEEGRSNFCAGIYLDGDYAGFSVCDISTGQTHVTAFSGPDREAHLQNELGRFAPAEAVLNPGAAEDAALRALLEDKLRCHVERLPAGRFQLPAAEKRIRQQFGDDAAQRPRNRHGDGHGDRLGGYRVEYLASGAERHGDIYDAQHARHATRKGGDADREQASAQLFDLFVEQVAECDDRHAQGKVEDARGFLVAGIADVRRTEEYDDGDEREQHGMQQRHPDAAVDRRPEAVKPHGERQQEEVGGEERLVNHCPGCLRRFHEGAGCGAGASGGSGSGTSAPSPAAR